MGWRRLKERHGRSDPWVGPQKVVGTEKDRTREARLGNRPEKGGKSKEPAILRLWGMVPANHREDSPLEGGREG